MIYTCVVYHTGYIFRTDRPEYKDAVLHFADIVVPEMLKKEEEIARAISDTIIYGTGTVTL